jgi:hypothetical protein
MTRTWWLREMRNPTKGSFAIATPVAYPYDVYPPMNGSYWLRKPAFKVVSRDDLQPFINKMISAFEAHDDASFKVTGIEFLKAWENFNVQGK